MAKRLATSVTGVIIVIACLCVAVCCAAQAAGKYVMCQEKKNVLMESMEENVDVLRLCLSPYSRMSEGGTPISIDPNKVSEIVNSAGSADN